MAIQKTITHLGLTVDNCYIKVTSIHGDKTQLSALVQYQSDSESPAFKTSQIEGIPWDCNMGAIQQVYAHIKSLDEFLGAIDC